MMLMEYDEGSTRLAYGLAQLFLFSGFHFLPALVFVSWFLGAWGQRGGLLLLKTMLIIVLLQTDTLGSQMSIY